MLRHPSQLLSCLIAGGLFACATAPASAQSFENAGVVRISDSVMAPIPEGTSYPQANCPPGSSAGYGGMAYDSGYGYGGRHTFSPPVKRPIYRTGVAYNKMWPNSWTGQPGVQGTPQRYPTVYMPTDTTQLGYYYQHVPYWQPRAGMIPPPPVPSQWHTTVAQTTHYGHPGGLILGTAPTATPLPTPGLMPTSPPWTGANGSQVMGAPIQNDSPIPTPAPIIEDVQPSAGLEKSASSPSLIPIN
ncbi:hypothetical protein [Planctomicrobium piriforme]|uniref:YXWGXW repeat-containing protein n=1 Tax=Planctomicrobium piriforme TaxID=1576369 RepID=A0A1I3G0N0_9PLAN|nr:hypothetical protein [Planctomicrobium piriforme]SFI16862.1 hypothetical protein SAMN05421753_106114 [Planctomicrobium piriforme]